MSFLKLQRISILGFLGQLDSHMHQCHLQCYRHFGNHFGQISQKFELNFKLKEIMVLEIHSWTACHDGIKNKYQHFCLYWS